MSFFENALLINDSYTTLHMLMLHHFLYGILYYWIVLIKDIVY